MKILHAIAGGFAALALTASANADVLINTITYATGDATNSNDESVQTGLGGPLYEAFTTTQTGYAITGVSFGLAYTDLIRGATLSSSPITIAIYADAGGAPGAVVDSDTVSGADLAAAFAGVGVEDFYLGSADLSAAPIFLDAGKTYWIGLSASGPTALEWVYASDIAGVAYGDSSPGGDFQPSAGATTPFELQITAVPEPATVSLLGAGLIGISRLRRRRS